MAVAMSCFGRLMVGWLVATGCMLTYAVPAAASGMEMPAAYHLAGSPRTTADARLARAGRLTSAWAQGVALPNHDQDAAGVSLPQDDETVFQRLKQGVDAVAEQAAGALTRPAPKLGGLMLVLLTVFALVLGVLSLRWHRETAE
jgi:hypothetical protein